MNKNNSIIQTLFELNGRIEKISGNINNAKNSLVSCNMYKYEEYITKAILSIENTTLRLRELANYSLKLNNCPLASQKISDKISNEIHNIKVENCDKYFHITMPETMPHYGNVSKCILTAPLNNSLKNFNKEHRISKYKKAVIVFINHINRDKSISTIRDNDNYDYKQVINTLAYWFLPDDSYKCCNMFVTTKESETAYSEIFIVPTENYPDFVKENLSNIM